MRRRIVVFATPVIRTIEGMETPSTRAATTRDRVSGSSLFIHTNLCLLGQEVKCHSNLGAALVYLKARLVPRAGFGPATSRLVVCRSIPLSYRGTKSPTRSSG